MVALLLDKGPHTVSVIPQLAKDDGYGGTEWVDGEPVPVRGSMQPTSATETQAMGLQANTSYSFITRGPWPWPSETEVLWEGPSGQWPGRKWDQVGEANVYSTGRLTKHISITLKAQKGVPVGLSV